MGYGYTDEAIKRLTPDQALDLIEKTCKSSEHEVAYWSGRRDDYPRPDFAGMHREWLKQLERERDALRSLLDQIERLVRRQPFNGFIGIAKAHA